MKLKNVTPKNDIIFKRLFGVKGREEITKDLLEGLLERKINSVTLGMETELLPDFYGGKDSKIDVRAELDDGTQVNIEMQVDPDKYSEKRCLEYWSKLYSSVIEKGAKYESLKKTIAIWIVDGLVYKDFEKFESTWKIKEDELGITGHFDDLEIHIIELQKFRKAAIIKPSKKEFWLWFIDHINKEMMEMACIDNARIKEAKEQLEKITSDKELMYVIINQQMAEMDAASSLDRAINKGRAEGEAKGRAEGEAKGRAEGEAKGRAEGRAEGEAKGRAEGEAKGRAEGEAKGKIEVAKKLKAKGIAIETIAEATGLSKEEIEEL